MTDNIDKADEIAGSITGGMIADGCMIDDDSGVNPSPNKHRASAIVAAHIRPLVEALEATVRKLGSQYGDGSVVPLYLQPAPQPGGETKKEPKQ